MDIFTEFVPITTMWDEVDFKHALVEAHKRNVIVHHADIFEALRVSAKFLEEHYHEHIVNVYLLPEPLLQYYIREISHCPLPEGRDTLMIAVTNKGNYQFVACTKYKAEEYGDGLSGILGQPFGSCGG